MKADESISKYGFLQEVVKMNDGDNAADLAKKNLDELNREDETYSGENNRGIGKLYTSRKYDRKRRC